MKVARSNSILPKKPGTHRMHFAQLLECAQSIRNCCKPVIAAVNGRAIGSGNQLQLLCDLAISSDKAVFGQHGSKRSGAPLFWGTTLMSMFVGERKAREIIFLSREYSAQEALDMGLVNKVVPHDKLYDEVKEWCDEILTLSPTSLRIFENVYELQVGYVVSGLVPCSGNVGSVFRRAGTYGRY